jgi:hypothetical protein
MCLHVRHAISAATPKRSAALGRRQRDPRGCSLTAGCLLVDRQCWVPAETGTHSYGGCGAHCWRGRQERPSLYTSNGWSPHRSVGIGISAHGGLG